MKKVVILGGGVAGLSAAHELMERGFDVTVFEYKQIPGGKARSIPVPDSGRQGRKNLPGEHGFRFFPGFYQHMPDTMKRIPYRDNEQGVFDNLVSANRLGLARFEQDVVQFLASFPKNLEDLRDLFHMLLDNDLPMTKEDIEAVNGKLWQMMTSSMERRQGEYQKVSWWDFVDAEHQSENFQKFIAALPRVCVAANAHEANAATIGDVLAALMLDIITPGSTSDRVLNGPTNDVWITPWIEHLRQNGVDCHLGADVQSINCDGDKITSVTVCMNGETFDFTADFYVSAVPVEVMALLLNQNLLHADPTLESIKDLAKSVDWMTGIQFFLTKDLSIVEGHVAYMDSPWALTSIFQKQFWPDTDLSEYGDGTVRDILSVDISDWHRPGVYVHKKPAIECTKQEIYEEVWAQLKNSLLIDGREVLKDEDLHSWFLDPDILFVNPHETVNLEPLLVNKVGTWDLRPNAYTRIPNFFLAADYVRTNTDLATMEGANEAARRAVNAILEAADSDAKPCKIWDMYEPELLALYRRHDRKRYEDGLPWDGKMFSFI